MPACRRSGTSGHEQKIFGHPKFLWQLKKIIKFWGIRHLEFKIFLGEVPQTPRKMEPPFLIPWLRACILFCLVLFHFSFPVYLFPPFIIAFLGYWVV